MKSKRRKVVQVKKQHKKSEAYLKGGKKSSYARKHAYLSKHELWGFEVAEPKPWKGAR